MKKSLILTIAAGLLGLASCGTAPASSATTEPSSASSSSLPSSSSSLPSESSSTSSQDWVDYAKNGDVKLNLAYQGHTFFVDGIEQVDLLRNIDGDTAHFTPKSGLAPEGVTDNTIKARFYGIDTPESTGKVQPYGKAASKYTSSILDAAAKNGTIVVSSAQNDYGTPNPDSTGSRYVSLIWVNTEKKDAGLDELYLLNLMIVQNGYSWVKNVADMPQYKPTFYAAEEQARAYKLNLFSGQPDPLFNYGDYEDTSLLDIKHEVVRCMNDPEATNAYDNRKVRVQGTVAGFSNKILYIQDFYPTLDENGNEQLDEEGNVIGEYAAINIFTGANSGSVPTKFKKMNAYIEVFGLCTDGQFGFQISDVTLPTVSYSDTDCRVIYTPENNVEEHALHVFSYSKAELSAVVDEKNFESLYCAVEVNEPITIRRAFAPENGSGMYLYPEGASFSIYFTFSFKPDASSAEVWDKAEDFVGKKFNVAGILADHTTSSGNETMQVLPRSNADLVLVTE